MQPDTSTGRFRLDRVSLGVAAAMCVALTVGIATLASLSTALMCGAGFAAALGAVARVLGTPRH